ncbi:MAG: hypothetical protein QOF05_125 [Sphingomonadales bacterium]|jgi:hypothetical protein|nr:hypothetical protein [Sphingomonadales bacterium]
MDGFREYPTEFDLPQADEVAQPYDVAAAIGTDERRMHVRAYNHWVSLLRGRDFPSIEELEPDDVQDFADHSVLLDFTCGRGDPAIPYVGTAIRDECGLNDDMRTIADVPSRSLLSRLTDHYLQIIANRSPVGFEAEFENPAGKTICYRGILMPFSSDGEAIDFIYGVINWKHAEAPAQGEASVSEDPQAETVAREASVEDETLAADEPVDLIVPFADAVEPEVHEESAAELDEPSVAPPRVPFSWENEADDDDTAITLDADARLADRLWAARETAETVKAGEGRTRSALYRALSLAYDFAVVADRSPDEYAELLEESGVKAQARAPMTPIVKLVFGIDYDKARLTEFAAALSFARRQSVELGAFQPFIENQSGGLKALVAAERSARRPGGKVDSKGEAARARLRAAPALSLADVPAGDEFALVVTRRGLDGRHEPVAFVDDEALVERAIRRTV